MLPKSYQMRGINFVIWGIPSAVFAKCAIPIEVDNPINFPMNPNEITALNKYRTSPLYYYQPEIEIPAKFRWWIGHYDIGYKPF